MPCYIRTQNGHTVIACARTSHQKQAHCRYCGRPAPLLCDYPLPGGGTCDAPICHKCSVRVSSNTDYCTVHNQTSPVKKEG